jgi:hypothetical protein
MKAICASEFGGPEVLKLEDMPDPRPPQSGGILVSVNAAGVTEALWRSTITLSQVVVFSSIPFRSPNERK